MQGIGSRLSLVVDFPTYSWHNSGMSNIENTYGLNRRQFVSILAGANLGILGATYCGEKRRLASIDSIDLNTWTTNGQSLLALYPDLRPVNYLAQGGKPLHRNSLLTDIQKSLIEKTTSLPDLKILPQYSENSRLSRPNLVGYRVVVEQRKNPLNKKIDDVHTLSGLATVLDLASFAEEYVRATMPWLGSLNQKDALSKVINRSEFCEFAKFAGRMRVGAMLRAILGDQIKEGILLTQSPLVFLEYQRYQEHAEEKGLLFKDKEGIWRWPGNTMPRINWQDYKDFLERSSSRLTNGADFGKLIRSD